MAKALYHEYKVYDQNGNLIGYEGFTRSGRTFWSVNKSNSSMTDDSS